MDQAEIEKYVTGLPLGFQDFVKDYGYSGVTTSDLEEFIIRTPQVLGWPLFLNFFLAKKAEENNAEAASWAVKVGKMTRVVVVIAGLQTILALIAAWPIIRCWIR